MRVALVYITHAADGGVDHLTQVGHKMMTVCNHDGEAPHPDFRFVRLRPRHVGGATKLWAFARSADRHLVSVRCEMVYGLGKTRSHDVIHMGGGFHQTYLYLIAGTERRRFSPSPWLWLKDRVALAVKACGVRRSG